MNCFQSEVGDYHHCWFVKLGLNSTQKNSVPYGSFIFLRTLCALVIQSLTSYVIIFEKNFRCPYLGAHPFSRSNLSQILS